MNISVGIVGLPNVGKSTLFNALLKKQQALAANYPFATIEPNVGVVGVPDKRLEKLARIEKEEHKMAELPPQIPATVKFVDIAGLVAGASKGEGLGNKFLSHIREVDAIAQVMRDFADEDVIRSGSVDPKSDYEVIETELILADLDTVLKIKDGKDKLRAALATKVYGFLEKGTPARDIVLSDEELVEVKQWSLLTLKPEILVLNVDEKVINLNNLSISGFDHDFVVVCAKIEAELSELSEEEQKEYLKDLGKTESGLERFIQKAFDTLGLQTFLTAGEKEVRAWTIKKGSKAPQAAGVIHGDFEKHFIKANVVNFDDFITIGGWGKAKELGKMRIEGKEYVMRDGDVVEFMIGS